METEYYEGGTPIYDKNGVFIGSYTPLNAELKQGRNLSPWEERLAEKRKKILDKQYDDQKELEGGLTNFLGFLDLFDPSRYVGPLFNPNGKPYKDNVMEGNRSGNEYLDLAIALAVPDATDVIGGNLLLHGVKSVGKKGVNVIKALPKITKRVLPSP